MRHQIIDKWMIVSLLREIVRFGPPLKNGLLSRASGYEECRLHYRLEFSVTGSIFQPPFLAISTLNNFIHLEFVTYNTMTINIYSCFKSYECWSDILIGPAFLL